MKGVLIWRKVVPGAKMLYFVLYIVLITELLIVITERDELEEVEKNIRTNMLGSIAASYKAPITLTATPKFLDYNVAAEEGREATVRSFCYGFSFR